MVYLWNRPGPGLVRFSPLDLMYRIGEPCMNWCAILILLLPGDSAPSGSPALTAGHTILPAGQSGEVIVSGRVGGQSTFGVTVLVELVPRPGAVGQVRFTPGPPSDIVQLGDPWPGAGTFTAFDTDSTASDELNGMVDDNGSFQPGPLLFDGELARFPIEADANAQGIWDAVLATTAGDSNWEGLPTTLDAGSIVVPSSGDIPAASTWSLAILAISLSVVGSLRVPRRTAPIQAAARR